MAALENLPPTAPGRQGQQEDQPHKRHIDYLLHAMASFWANTILGKLPSVRTLA
jgi:hypothetical protein